MISSRILWCHVLCLHFKPFLSLFLCLVWGYILTSFIYMHLSNFPSTSCWKDFYFHCIFLFGMYANEYNILLILIPSSYNTFFVFCDTICFEVCFVWCEYCYSAASLLSFPFAPRSFPSPHFQSLRLSPWSGISCRHHIEGSFLKKKLLTTLPLIRAFNPLTFKIIVDRFVLIAILLLVSSFVDLCLCFYAVVWFSSVVCLSSFLFWVFMNLL